MSGENNKQMINKCLKKLLFFKFFKPIKRSHSINMCPAINAPIDM
jgi:hypothetical protein